MHADNYHELRRHLLVLLTSDAVAKKVKAEDLAKSARELQESFSVTVLPVVPDGKRYVANEFGAWAAACRQERQDAGAGGRRSAGAARYDRRNDQVSLDEVERIVI